MQRIFPTQLLVVGDNESLDAEQEKKRGYWDSQKGNDVSISVSEEQHAIYLSAPAYWFRSYCIVVPSYSADELWQIVSSVIKTECGRKVVHKAGETEVTVTNLNKDHAKQVYYLFKHLLTKSTVPFTVSWSLALSIMSSKKPAETEPDIRKRRENKRKHRKTSNTTTEKASETPWIDVVRKNGISEIRGLD